MQNTAYQFIEKKRSKFFALPLYFTRYSIGAEKLTIRRGFLNITEDDAYMYKIQDVRLTKSLLERIFRLGTIVCFTGDTTDPKLELQNIRHADEIKEYLITASEEARLKRRTRYNVNVGSDDMEDDETFDDAVNDI